MCCLLQDLNNRIHLLHGYQMFVELQDLVRKYDLKNIGYLHLMEFQKDFSCLKQTFWKKDPMFQSKDMCVKFNFDI